MSEKLTLQKLKEQKNNLRKVGSSLCVSALSEVISEVESRELAQNKTFQEADILTVIEKIIAQNMESAKMCDNSPE